MDATVSGALKFQVEVEIPIEELAGWPAERVAKMLAGVRTLLQTASIETLEQLATAAPHRIGTATDEELEADQAEGDAFADADLLAEQAAALAVSAPPPPLSHPRRTHPALIREDERERRRRSYICGTCGNAKNSNVHFQKCGMAKSKPVDKATATTCKSCHHKYWQKEHRIACNGEKPAQVNGTRRRGASHGGVKIDDNASDPDYSEYGEPRPIPSHWTRENDDGERLIVEPLTAANRHFHLWKTPARNPDFPLSLARCSCGNAVAIINEVFCQTWELEEAALVT